LIIGEKEVEAGTVSVRRQGEGDKGVRKPEEFINLVREEIFKEIGNTRD